MRRAAEVFFNVTISAGSAICCKLKVHGLMTKEDRSTLAAIVAASISEHRLDTCFSIYAAGAPTVVILRLATPRTKNARVWVFVFLFSSSVLGREACMPHATGERLAAACMKKKGARWRTIRRQHCWAAFCLLSHTHSLSLARLGRLDTSWLTAGRRTTNGASC